MNDSIKKILIKYLNEKNFSKYNEILRIEIISFFVKKIQKKDSFFLYSNLIELLQNVEIYLAKEDIFNFKYFYNLYKNDYEPETLSKYLTDVYEKIVI